MKPGHAAAGALLHQSSQLTNYAVTIAIMGWVLSHKPLMVIASATMLAAAGLLTIAAVTLTAQR